RLAQPGADRLVPVDQRPGDLRPRPGIRLDVGLARPARLAAVDPPEDGPGPGADVGLDGDHDGGGPAGGPAGQRPASAGPPPTPRRRADPLPSALALTDGGQVAARNPEPGPPEPFHAGRLTYDAASHTLQMHGVLPDTEASRLIEETAPAPFRAHVEALKKESE